jgi:hypothetical protein
VKTTLLKREVRVAVALATILGAREASAEISVARGGGWELFSDGRIGGFISYTKGDGYPVITATQNPYGGGISANMANPIADPNQPLVQPTLESMRIRSGFLGNIFAIGVRRQLTEYTSLTGYLQFWSDIETESRRKYLPMPIDVRQGYMRIEGRWGGVVIGRQLTLYSRGAAEIDFLYGHGYGLGFPGNIDSSGPAAGHVGTGVIGPGFAAGFMYMTPVAGGLQLNVGIYDPVQLQGAWDRTKWARPEAELTYDVGLGTRGKLHLFANGIYQKVYLIGNPDSVNATVYGAGYGGRVEVGPLHVGVAAHYGQGLGLYYALETSEAAYDSNRNLRKSDGYYLQTQLALTKFDINLGAGISRIYELPTDGVPDPTSGVAISVIKYQLGLSAVLVYHVTPMLHVTAEYFRANYRWFLGEKQDVNFVNTGVTMVW